MTATSMTSDLIERLERATAGNRELDKLIAEFVGHTFGVPEYTTSIDAALTLVDGFWAVGKQEFEPFARILVPNEHGDFIGQRNIEATGATPALALCIAALRARYRDGE